MKQNRIDLGILGLFIDLVLTHLPDFLSPILHLVPTTIVVDYIDKRCI